MARQLIDTVILILADTYWYTSWRYFTISCR